MRKAKKKVEDWDFRRSLEHYQRIFDHIFGCDHAPQTPEVVSPEEELRAAERHEEFDRMVPWGVDEMRWSEYNRKFNDLLRKKP